MFWFFDWYLKELFEAMGRQHQVLVQSNVEWIAVRPVLLDEGPRKGNYRVVIEGIPSKGYRINTGDVAEFMLKNLVANEYLHKVPSIAY